MSLAQPKPLLRLLPSLTDVAVLLPLVFLFSNMGGTRTLLGDGDTGWHIRTGEWILANGRVPDRDIFSFTKPGEPWFAWEWLWDVLFARLHQWAGMPAVLLASILVIALTFALLFRLVRLKCDNVFIAIAVTLLAGFGSSLHFLARPHVFTWLFLVLFYSVLERFHDGQYRGLLPSPWILALLPALMVLWTSLHGGFFVGIALAASYALGELAGALFAPDASSRRAALRRARPYGMAAAACLLASLVNPYGYRLHAHILTYLRDPFQFQHINEFLSLSFQHPVARFFEPMVLLAGVAAFWHLARLRLSYVLMLVMWAHLALMSARNIPLFLIVAAPIIAQCLHEILRRVPAMGVAPWLRRVAQKLECLGVETGAIDRVPRLHLVSAAGLVLLAAIFYAPNPPEGFRPEYDRKTYPAQALGFLDSAGSGRIFAPDVWGGYLIYRRYPNIKVFVDGRSDFYGAKFDQKFLDVLNVKYNWESTLRGYAVDTVLVPADSQLSATLKESQRWRLVYDDGVAIIFRAATDPSRRAQVSVVQGNSGTSRDREITKLEPRDRQITPSTT